MSNFYGNIITSKRPEYSYTRKELIKVVIEQSSYVSIEVSLSGIILANVNNRYWMLQLKKKGGGVKTWTWHKVWIFTNTKQWIKEATWNKLNLAMFCQMAINIKMCQLKEE